MLRRVRDWALPSITRDEPIQAWIIDDTGFPKKGSHSVGVARQYCGQLGKQDNCQVAVSLSVATHQGSLSVAYRLYLPKEWADDAGRRATAGVPDHVSGEHGYDGSLRSVQRFWAKHYPAPAIRARRRVETPPGVQAQADWAHFPQVVIGGEVKNLVAFKMVLSHSRKDAIVWSESKDMLSWLGCHSEAFRRLGGVPATVRIDNEKTAMARGAGAWGIINKSYRRYATTLRFHVDACPPRQPQCKGKIERRVRDQRFAIDPRRYPWSSLEDLQQWTDAQLTARSNQLICPATGLTVAESWVGGTPEADTFARDPAGTV